MNKRALVTGLAVVISAVAMTALAQVDTASTTPITEELATTTEPTVSEESTTPVVAESEALPETQVAVQPEVAVTASEEVGVVQPTVPANVHAVISLEDAYFAKNGKYLQILAGNKLPEYESGTIAEKLGADAPTGIRIDVYESPDGFGYQVTYDENGAIHSVGFGPEAAERTYSQLLPVATASSTPESL